MSKHIDFTAINATTNLPVNFILHDVERVLDAGRHAVIIAPPGSGKTSLIPLALYKAAWRSGRKIILVVPRRVAVRSAAQRMAHLCNLPVGQLIGFSTRLERKVSAKTRIEVVTEGLFVRRILADPFLEDVAAVIFDEAHERSLDLDTGLALALSCHRHLRADLRIVVMSATLAAQVFIDRLDAELITCSGREHKLSITYAVRDVLTHSDLPKQAATYARRALAEHSDGNILVFLPGMREIRQTQALLEEVDARVLTLHGDLTPEAQDQVFVASAKRTIVLATSIAETSVTLPDTRIVIDGGFRRVARYDAPTGLSRLETVRISRAAADQRAGRAGREGPGYAIRLWTEAKQRGLPPHEAPEIRSSDLSPMVLQFSIWRDVSGIEDVEEEQIEKPSDGAVDAANTLLVALNALEDQRLTPFGRSMSKWGTHPRLAAILASADTVHERALAGALCALLEEKDPLRRNDRMTGPSSDITLRLDALENPAAHAENRALLRRISLLAARYRSDLSVPLRSEIDHRCAGRLLAAGFPDRIAMAGSSPGQYRLAGGGSVRLSANDPLAKQRFIVAARLNQNRITQAELAAAVTPETLPPEIQNTIVTKHETTMDPATGRVISRERRHLGRLILSERNIVTEDIDPTDILMEELGNRLHDTLNWTDPCRQLQARVMHGRRLRDDLPLLDDAHLTSTRATWLPAWIAGLTSLREVAALDLIAVLGSLLSWEQKTWLDKSLPNRLSLPGGSVAIDYTQPVPVASARAQTFYGCQETPQIAGGAIALQFALLSPAGRVQAITSDLAAFWRGGWADMRRDMRGRYPKHDWPENPAIATATYRPRRPGGKTGTPQN